MLGRNTGLKQNSDISYSWAVLTSVALMTFLCMGMVMVGFSLFFPYMKTQFGFSDSQIGYLLTIRNTCSFIGKAFTVFLISNISSRYTVILTSFLAVVSLACCLIAKSYFVFAVSMLFAGVSNGFGNMITVAIVLRKWFKDRLPIAIGIASAGSGLSSIICPVIITSWTEKYGLQHSFALYFITSAILLFFVVLLIRESPEKIGRLPYTSKTADTPDTKERHAGQFKLNVMGFALLYISSICLGMFCVTSASNLGLHYSSINLDAKMMASCTSVFGIALFIGKLGQGFLTEKLGGLKTCIISFALLIAGCFINFTVIRNIPLIMAAAFCCGYGTSIGSMGSSIWADDFASEDQYETTIGRCQTLQSLGGLIFSPLPGLIAEPRGNYLMVWKLYFAMSIILAVTVLIVYYVRSKRKANSSVVVANSI